MTSFRQIEANRRNAGKSTGPSTDAGKARSRRNALRHGLTAETVIGQLEDAEDYKCFEATVTADFNPETAVERELVLRLASLLWRLRRAASIETGMFQNSAKVVAEGERTVEPARDTLAVVEAHGGTVSRLVTVRPMLNESNNHQALLTDSSDPDDTGHRLGEETDTNADTLSHLASRFLHLAGADKGAFERLGRYELALWRQVCQTVVMLEMLRRQSLDTKWLPRSSHPRRSNSFSLPTFIRR